MQHARAFGGQRERAPPSADPNKRWEYLNYQNQQQQRQVLAKVPRGSRVFQRNRDLEGSVRAREDEQRKRAEAAEVAKQSSAVRLTRSFGSGRGRVAPVPEAAPVEQAPGRPFGATRQRVDAHQQALAMELETPWHWLPPASEADEEDDQ